MLTQEEMKKEFFEDMNTNLKKVFKRFHSKNPEVYNLFEKFSLQAFSSNRNYYSHWAVAQRIRWYTNIETTGTEFKLSNDLIAVYARLVVLRNPKLYGFFKFKKMKSKRVGAKI